jgi:hypothetical protein
MIEESERTGTCELCGKRTHTTVYNTVWEDWDFICETCQPGLSVLEYGDQIEIEQELEF